MPSEGEETFWLHCRAHNLTPEREYRFAAPRRWRADFCWPDQKLIVEIEGGQWIQGRHQRGSGFALDCAKYNAAVLAGYRVLRYTTEMVRLGRAIEEVGFALDSYHTYR